MKKGKRFSVASRMTLLAIMITSIAATNYIAQQVAANMPQAMNWTTAEDHQNMLQQLGIKKLRPAPSGSVPENDPRSANYDEAKANPFPDLPEVLTLKNGKKVTTPDMWWNQRRPEILEDFDREVLGRVPRNAPKVTWAVTQTVQGMVGSYPVIGK